MCPVYMIDRDTMTSLIPTIDLVGKADIRVVHVVERIAYSQPRPFSDRIYRPASNAEFLDSLSPA